jgi:hypothetical protein
MISKIISLSLLLSSLISCWNICVYVNVSYLTHDTLSSLISLNTNIINMYSIFAIKVLLYEYLKGANVNIVATTISTWILLCFHEKTFTHLCFTLITCSNMMKYMSEYGYPYITTCMYIILHCTWITFTFVSDNIYWLEVVFVLFFAIQYYYDNLCMFLLKAW